MLSPTTYDKLRSIVRSHTNGQKKEMAASIDEYGAVFWVELVYYLQTLGMTVELQYMQYMKMNISYSFIKEKEAL